MSEDHTGARKMFPSGDQGRSRFDQVKSDFDAYATEFRRQRDAWMLAAFVCFFAFVVAAASVWYVSTLPDVRYRVIEVSSWGEAKYRGEADNTSSDGTIFRPAQSILYHLRRFIENTRTYSTDPVQERKMLNEVFSSTTDKVATALKLAWEKESPYELAKTRNVGLTIETVFAVTALSYQVEWRERELGPDNNVSRNERYRALVTLHFQDPLDLHKEYNPLGIYIAQYDITKVGDVAE